MLNKLLKIILIIFIFSLFACYPTLDKEAETPEDSLVSVKYFYPDFRDDMDLNSLTGSIEKSLEYLDRLDPEFIFFYGAEKFTCIEVKKALKLF